MNEVSGELLVFFERARERGKWLAAVRIAAFVHARTASRGGSSAWAKPAAQRGPNARRKP